MLDVRPAAAHERDGFLELMRTESADYLPGTLALMQMTWDQFAHLFHTRGQVYGLYQDDRPAGFYWIEQRENILHVHGLFLTPACQGQGLGTRVLQDLAREYQGAVDAIELGVHSSNAGARRLYERLGFRTIRTLPDLGFAVMQKPLAPPDA